MDSQKLTEKVLSKMKEYKIRPKSRWYFIVKNYFIWLFGFLALVISSAIFSVMFYLIKYNDFGLRHEINKSGLKIIFLTLPYFWILFLAIFIFIIFYNIKCTKNGYRYPLVFIVTGAILASLLIGIAFSLAGFGRKLDEVIGQRAPLYSEIINPQIDFWSQPEDGRLVGLILTSPIKNNTFKLIDKDGKEWFIILEGKFGNIGLLAAGEPIKLLGTKTSDAEFMAIKIMPLMPGNRFFERMQPGNNIMPPRTLKPGMHGNTRGE